MAALLFALLLLPHVSVAQEDPAAPSGPPIAIDADAVDDARIRQRIRAVLDELGGYGNVTVEVSAGVVTLRGEVLDETAAADLGRLAGRVEGVVTVRNLVRQNAALNERLAPALQRVMDRAESVLVAAPLVLIALAVFAIIALAGWLLTARVGLWTRLAPNSFIAEIYRALARIAFVLLGLIVALDILDATALIGAVLGAAGVVGLAVGFAVRDTVENFIASILLSLRQPFRPNDFVAIDGEMGNVARLTSRATILISPEGNHVRIPNATVFKGKIVNYTRDAKRRFTFDLGVDADSDLAAALSTAVEALAPLPFVLDEPPVGAWIAEVGESNVVLTFVGWIDQHSTDFAKARGEAIRIAKSALESAGFGLPEPIYRLRIDGQAPRDVPADAADTRARARPVPAPAPAELPQLPPQAAPDIRQHSIEDAVVRERNAGDVPADLLNESRKTE